jgi:hydroxymethylpyrimidine pyrophosphatase-like HAD family hydrolase
MSKIKLVITDVDGTLVTTEKAMRPSSVAAVRKLHDAGIGFTICSSRPPFGLTTMRDALQITLPFGGYNGGSIVEPDLTVIEQVCIPPNVARQAVDIFHANGVSTWVFVGNEWVILDRIMQESLGHSAHAARSQAYYCDVIAPGIDKGRIVELLGQRLGLTRDEIAVLGDMTNDLEMFTAAGLPIAMGNAPDHVKAKAKGIAPGTNDEDGWAGAVERYILAG